MKYELELTYQYLKDLRLARKRGLDEKPIPIYSNHIFILLPFTYEAPSLRRQHFYTLKYTVPSILLPSLCYFSHGGKSWG